MTDAPKKIGPFFKYFGGKHRAALKYPAPLYPLIIEPFAGSAGYACQWHDRAVLLNDADPRVIALWLDLLKMTPEQVLAFPDIPAGGTVADMPPEAQRLVSCWVNTVPWRNRPSTWFEKCPSSFWGVAARERIARWLPGIQHWDLVCGSYADLPDVEATWFVDPPYQGLPGMYKRGRGIDYTRLGEWCRTRRGQVIVCEIEGADWLPFEPLYVPQKTAGAITRKIHSQREMIWHRAGHA